MPKIKGKKLPDMIHWSEEKIHRFWKTHDSSDYWDETEPVEMKAVHLKQRAVSVKLEEQDIARLKSLAHQLGIGHTTLIRLWIKEKLRKQSHIKA